MFTYTWHRPMFYIFSSGATFDNDFNYYYYYWSLYLLIESSNLIFTMLILLSLSLNTLMCIDLYLTVKNPFSKGSSRIWYFSAIAVCGCFAVLIILFFSERKDRVALEKFAILIYFCIFVVFSIFSLIFVTRKLLKPGFSK